MKIPLIGLTVYHSTSSSGLPNVSVNEAYVQALIQAGAAPVLIPLGLGEAALRAILERLDGVLFTGGGDLEASLYGAQPHARMYDIDQDRDRIELYLVKELVAQEQPFMGICRGLQVINVALGGSLYTDIGDEHPGALRHDWYPNIPRDHLAHPVQISEASRLAGILGKPLLEVNSLHHQGVRQLAPGLTPTAYAPDGMVEAFELPEHPFGMAVQWHPEWLQAHAPMRALFKAFVEAAAQAHERSAPAE
jgi:putative glutamine amidotransferase